MTAFVLRLAIASSMLAMTPQLFAQTAGTPIENEEADDSAVIEQVEKLRVTGRLMNFKRFLEQAKAPLNEKIELIKPNTVELPAREVAKRARTGAVQVGWYFLCKRCDQWHINLSGGYAIAKDAIATCSHCIEPEKEMREGYLIAVDHTGQVIPITGILSCSDVMDAAVLRVDGGNLAPLPLNDQVTQGDAAYCLSCPLDQKGYFSSGIVNRFFLFADEKENGSSRDELKHLRLNVSTDWAPGSSGSAVLDSAANIIGHVSAISPLSDDAPEEPDTKTGKKAKEEHVDTTPLITLHEAIPARAIMALAHGEATSDVAPVVLAEARKQEKPRPTEAANSGGKKRRKP